METIHNSNQSVDEKEWGFYATPAAGFNDLYEQICDNEYRYLVYYLRQAIPLEGGYGFFDLLLTIYNQISYKEHGKYPEETALFHLCKEYIGNMYKEGKVKVKIGTPVRGETVPREGGGTSTTYTWINKKTYTRPDQLQDLLQDLEKRFNQLLHSPDDLRTFYGAGIIIADPNIPFWDEPAK